jgi:hypothetical protein
MRHLFALLLSMAVSPAFAFTTEAITITGGTFTLSDPYLGNFGSVSILPGPANTLNDGLINGSVDADGLHGSEINPVITFDFLGINMNGFFAHSVETCNFDCTSMITINDPDPGAITVTGIPWGPITADFSGFFVEWNGNRFLEGGQATGTGNLIAVTSPPEGGGPGFALYDISLHWSLVNPSGPFQGFTSDWVLTGTAMANLSQVPVPAAAWFFGSGLIGLYGLARKNQKA